jgi:hypothetical protein
LSVDVFHRTRLARREARTEDLLEGEGAVKWASPENA